MRHSNKYKLFIAGILLFVYLMTSFQKPFFEFIHLLAHSAEILQHQYVHHQHHDHDAAHSHDLIDSVQAAIYTLHKHGDTQMLVSLDQLELTEITNSLSFYLPNLQTSKTVPPCNCFSPHQVFTKASHPPPKPAFA